MSVTSTVARNTLYQAIGRLLYLITSLLTIKLLTNYLGEAGFGQYSIAVNYLGFFGVLVDLGLYLIIIQKITTVKDTTERETVLGNVIGLRVVSALLVFILASLIIFLFPYPARLQNGIVLCSLAFVFISLAQLFAGVFQGFLRSEFAALAEVAGRVVVLIGVVVTMQYDWGLWGIFVSLIIGNGFNMCLGYYLSRRFSRIRIHFDFQVWKGLIKEAAPLGLMLAISYLYVKQNTFILSLYPHLPQGLSNDAAVGIYNAPFKLLETVQGFPALFLGALFPFLSKYLAEKDNRVQSMCQKAFDFLVGLAMPMIVGTVLLAHRIIPIITNNDAGWGRAIVCLQILIFAVAFSFLNNFSGHVIIAQKAQKKLIIPNILYLITNLVINLLLIPLWSYNGSAVATVITESLVVVINFLIIKRLMGWSPRVQVLGKVLLSSLVMGFLVFALDRWSFSILFTIPAATLLYFGLLSWLRGLPEGIGLKDIADRLFSRV